MIDWCEVIDCWLKQCWTDGSLLHHLRWNQYSFTGWSFIKWKTPKVISWDANTFEFFFYIYWVKKHNIEKYLFTDYLKLETSKTMKLIHNRNWCWQPRWSKVSVYISLCCNWLDYMNVLLKTAECYFQNVCVEMKYISLRVCCPLTCPLCHNPHTHPLTDGRRTCPWFGATCS